MNAAYTIDVNPRQRLMAVTLTGFLTWNVFVELRRDVAKAINQIGCPPGQHLALWDIKNAKIQSQDIVGGFRAMSDQSAVAARQIAVVAGQSLMRMQLRRLIGDERVFQTFDTVLEARTWLLRSEIGSSSRVPSITGLTGIVLTSISSAGGAVR